MRFTAAIAASILAFSATGVLALPTPQLAGEGAAANSILSGTDNAVGYSVEEIEDNTANLISGTKGSTGSTGGSSSAPPPPPPHKRQLAGEGAAADSILSDTDNAVGYSVEEIEDNTANTISGTKGSTGSTGGSGSPPPPPPPHKRQLDKISNGLGAIGNAAGVGAVTDPVVAVGDSADGSLTSGAANAGAQIGSTEESTLEGAAANVPRMVRRQLDKISNGLGAIGNAAGVGAVTDPVVAVGDSADGSLTSGAANAGAQIGSTEESTLEGAAKNVPRM